MFVLSASQPVRVELQGIDEATLRLIVRALLTGRLMKDVHPATPQEWTDEDLQRKIDATNRVFGPSDGPSALHGTTFYSVCDLSIQVIYRDGQLAALDVSEYDQRHVRGEGTAQRIVDHVLKFRNADTLHFATPPSDDHPTRPSRAGELVVTASVPILTLGGIAMAADELFLAFSLAPFGLVLVGIGLVGTVLGVAVRHSA